MNTNNNIRDELTEKINKLIYEGKMLPQAYQLVDKCLLEYKFKPEVIFEMFEFLHKENIHYDFNALEIFFEECSKTLDPSTFIANKENAKERFYSIVRVMGKLSRRRLNGLDLERIENWVNELGTTYDMAEFAFRQNEYRGIILMKHVEDKLREWHRAGITTLCDAKDYEETRWIINKEKYLSKYRSEDNNV